MAEVSRNSKRSAGRWSWYESANLRTLRAFRTHLFPGASADMIFSEDKSGEE
jgi:hypothetical protein